MAWGKIKVRWLGQPGIWRKNARYDFSLIGPFASLPLFESETLNLLLFNPNCFDKNNKHNDDDDNNNNNNNNHLDDR